MKSFTWPLSGIYMSFHNTRPRTVTDKYLARSVDVEERLVSDAEGLLGFINLAQPHFLESWGDDLLLDTQQTSVEVTLTHRLTLQNKQFTHTNTHISDST